MCNYFENVSNYQIAALPTLLDSKFSFTFRKMSLKNVVSFDLLFHRSLVHCTVEVVEHEIVDASKQDGSPNRPSENIFIYQIHTIFIITIPQYRIISELSPIVDRRRPILFLNLGLSQHHPSPHLQDALHLPPTMTVPRFVARTNFRSAFTAARYTRTTRPLSIKSNSPPPFPVIQTCPAPTCACASPPELPNDLQIDREAPLNGAIPSYAQHVLICSGKRDWAKRIEDDDDIGGVVGELGRLIGPKGDYSDVWFLFSLFRFNDGFSNNGTNWPYLQPFYHTSTLASSFPPTTAPDQSNTPNTSVYILPAFKYIPFLSRDSPDDLEALVRGYLRPETLHPKYDDFPTARREQLVRKPEYRERLRGVRNVTEVVVLVCGHGGRDQRCGLYGPVLQAEFEKRLPEQGVEVLAEGVTGENLERGYAARVGQISHIGGHKFAGNVIVYIPPTLKAGDGGVHPLAGHGIWYGRVEPAHVEGIVSETIRKGRVVEELLRGGIRQDGAMLRL